MWQPHASTKHLFEHDKETAEIKLVKAGHQLQAQHPRIHPGLLLVEIAGQPIDSLELEDVQRLVSQADDSDSLSLVFQEEGGMTAEGEVVAATIAATNASDRVEELAEEAEDVLMSLGDTFYTR